MAIGFDGMPETQMTFTVIGLGSMGKRRIRCLQALGYTKICGLDLREDRRKEAESLYGIDTTDTLMGAYFSDAIFICTPPDKHLTYMEYASKSSIPFFVEHGILKQGLDAIYPKWCSPSCTMLFHPAIIELKKLIASGELGKISNVIYHSGQYLPDWHPFENVKNFYVSKKETGGAREIVPFELTWLVDLFGIPKVKAYLRKTIDIPGAESIDDTYNCLLDWEDFLGVLTVDVVSRIPTRQLIINSSERYLELDLTPGITEQIYINETRAFIDGEFPNTLEKEIKVLELLEAIECA